MSPTHLRSRFSPWLLCTVLLVGAGCSSADTAPADRDVGSQSDTVTNDTGAAEPVWRFSGGPNGAVSMVMPAAGRLYAVASSQADWQVLAKSVDDGHSWQQLGADNLDTLVLGQQGYLSGVESDGAELLFSSDALLRRDAHGEWSEVSPPPPTIATRPSASGSLIVYIGSSDGTSGLALSTDGASSWTLKSADPEYRFASARAWKGKIIAHDYSKIHVSDDQGEQWQNTSDGPPLDFERWAFLSETAAVHESSSDGKQTLHVSEDGLSWQAHQLDDALPPIQKLFSIDDHLVALTADGTVAELFVDGSWSKLSAPPDSGGRFRRAVATASGFIALQGGAMLDWSLDDGWGESLVEHGLATGIALAADQATWVDASDAHFVFREGEWSRLAPLFDAPTMIGVVDGTLLVADDAHCVYRRGNDNWEFVAQWREDDTVNASTCDPNQRPDGRLQGPVTWNGRVLIGRIESPGKLADLAGKTVDLPEGAPPQDIGVAGGYLWVVGNGRLYRVSNDAMSDQTQALSEQADAAQKVLRIADSSESVLVETTHETRPHTRRAFINHGDSWREIPMLGTEAPFYIVGINARGVFGLSDGVVWLYAHETPQWKELGEGLPPEAHVRSVSVADNNVAATLDSGGLWQLREQ